MDSSLISLTVLGGLRDEKTNRAFDDASLLHFPTGIDRDVIVSLEPGATRDLNTFDGKCLDQIEQYPGLIL